MRPRSPTQSENPGSLLPRVQRTRMDSGESLRVTRRLLGCDGRALLARACRGFVDGVLTRRVSGKGACARAPHVAVQVSLARSA